jgi:ABC-type branched-subunit amino acid transport system permease subunit
MVAAALVVFAYIVPHSGSFVILLATRALAFAILAMSVDLLLGYTGLASMGKPPISASALISPRSWPPNFSSAWAGIFGWWW